MSVSISEIESLLNEQVRPALALHQGDVTIKSLEDGILKVSLTGQCAGCPSAHSTNEELISTPVREAFPEITNVVLVEETSDELMDLARQILHHSSH